MPQTIILLIDDHAMFRAGLRMLIESAMIDVEVFEAGSMYEVMHGSSTVPAVAFKPDIVLLDLRLPGNRAVSVNNGLDGIALLNKKWPGTPVLVLSSHDDQKTMATVLQLGATGFVSKTESATTIVEAVQKTLGQQIALGQTNPCSLSQAQLLTPRQSDVLQLLSQGLSNKLIARHLQLSENTVRVHVQALLKFFHATSRAGAVFAARQQNLLK